MVVAETFALKLNITGSSGVTKSILAIWLTLEHRQKTVEAEEPEITTEETIQPAAVQITPEQESNEPVKEIPKWKQPGTMEYIAKMQLDQLVYNYKLNPDDDQKKIIKDAAAGLGVDLKTEYNLELKITEAKNGEDLFHGIEGSGFENGGF